MKLTILKAIAIIIGMFLGSTIYNAVHAAGPTCSKYCSPAVSTPCGNACIPKDKICRKDWTTACVGERPKSAKKGYKNPKHVNKAPK